MAAIVEACPPPDTGRGRGPLTASYREAMTQMAMGGAGVMRSITESSSYITVPELFILQNQSDSEEL